MSDALRTNLRNAVEQRGEVRQIIRRGEDECQEFSIELTVELSGQREGRFSVSVGEEEGLSAIQEESCFILSPTIGKLGYVVQHGRMKALSTYLSPTSAAEPPPARTDQLYLPVFSGYPGFAELHDAMRGMRFFNINPGAIRSEAAHGRTGGRTGLGWQRCRFHPAPAVKEQEGNQRANRRVLVLDTAIAGGCDGFDCKHVSNESWFLLGGRKPAALLRRAEIAALCSHDRRHDFGL